MIQDRHVMAPFDARDTRARQGDHGDGVQAPRERELAPHVVTCLARRLDLASPPVAVLLQDPIANPDGTGPVLGVDDENSRWADRDVVDVGPAPPWPPNVVQHLEPVGPQQFELGAHRLLARGPTRPVLGGCVDAIGLLDQCLRLLPETLRTNATVLRLLVRRLTRLQNDFPRSMPILVCRFCERPT